MFVLVVSPVFVVQIFRSYTSQVCLTGLATGGDVYCVGISLVFVLLVRGMCYTPPVKTRGYFLGRGKCKFLLREDK